MNEKKTRDRFVPRPDESLPGKANVDPRLTVDEVPSYKGPAKTETRATPRRGKAKAEVEPQATKRPRNPKEMTDLPDMKPPRRRAAVTADTGRADRAADQYIRLRIRVRGEQMSVVDSHLVDGPLSSINAFPGNNAYEVTLGDRLLHAGALPDLGEQRAFVAPNPAEGESQHHFTERDVFEFSARLPAAEVTAETIGDVAVRLHRVKGEARAERLTDQPLTVQFEREMRPVAELVGLPESALPERIEARGGRTPQA
jgi:hypothetical protein